MYEVSKRMYAGGMAALQYMATRLQARAVDAAPRRGAPKVTGRANCTAAIKQGSRTPLKFEIPVALEAAVTVKLEFEVVQTQMTEKPILRADV